MRLLVALPRTVLTLAVGVVATLIGGPLVMVISRFRPTSPLIDRVAAIWSRLWLFSAGCRLEVSGREHIDPTRSYMVVANHLSALDIMACFLAVPLPIRFLAKKELFRVPVLAPAMRAVGIVEVDREARSTVHEKVNAQAGALVQAGRSIIVYPEGTRSRDGRLGAFKKGAFTMAVSWGLPVLPVTLHGTYEAWRPGSPLVYGGTTIKVVIDAPIDTRGLTQADVGRLRDEARTVIAKRVLELGGEVAG
jgi:1-acyl-sn-glycerol-3-phosphate acyltransferase